MKRKLIRFWYRFLNSIFLHDHKWKKVLQGDGTVSVQHDYIYGTDIIPATYEIEQCRCGELRQWLLESRGIFEGKPYIDNRITEENLNLIKKKNNY